MTMAPPFQPVSSSGMSRKALVLELLRSKKVGEVITYDELAEKLGLQHPGDRAKIQAAVHQAAPTFLKVDLQSLMAVANTGYRIVEAEKHIEIARGHQAKSTRSLARGRDQVIHVDFNEMTDEGKALAQATMTLFAAQLAFNQRMDVRQRNIERAISSLTSQQKKGADATNKALADMRARIAKMEKLLPDGAVPEEPAPEAANEPSAEVGDTPTP